MQNPQVPSALSEAVNQYARELAGLTFNSKPIINALTMVAGENLHISSQIVQLIEDRIRKTEPDKILPAMYLLDSIIKNIGGVYLELFSQRIVYTFCDCFERVEEESTRASLVRLLQTWPGYFPADKLHSIDERVAASRGTQQQQQPHRPANTGGIHVNPKFVAGHQLQQQQAQANVSNQEGQHYQSNKRGRSEQNEEGPRPTKHKPNPRDENRHDRAGRRTRYKANNNNNFPPQEERQPRNQNQNTNHYNNNNNYPAAQQALTNANALGNIDQNLLTQLVVTLLAQQTPAAPAPMYPQVQQPQSYLSASSLPQQTLASAQALSQLNQAAQVAQVASLLSQISPQQPSVSNPTYATPALNIPSQANNPLLTNPSFSGFSNQNGFDRSNTSTTTQSFQKQGAVPQQQSQGLPSVHSIPPQVNRSRPTTTFSQLAKIDVNDLKRRDERVINSLYSDYPMQCNQCALRFYDRIKMEKHLDLHFKFNRKIRTKKPSSRTWFLTLAEWRSFDSADSDQGQTTGLQSNPFFTGASEENDESAAESASAAVYADENQTACPVCGEKFELFLEPEKEEWMYKSTLRSPADNVIYHLKCAPSMSSSAPPFQGKTENNTLLVPKPQDNEPTTPPFPPSELGGPNTLQGSGFPPSHPFQQGLSQQPSFNPQLAATSSVPLNSADTVASFLSSIRNNTQSNDNNNHIQPHLSSFSS